MPGGRLFMCEDGLSRVTERRLSSFGLDDQFIELLTDQVVHRLNHEELNNRGMFFASPDRVSPKRFVTRPKRCPRNANAVWSLVIQKLNKVAFTDDAGLDDGAIERHSPVEFIDDAFEHAAILSQ